jgi:hypothetical protein
MRLGVCRVCGNQAEEIEVKSSSNDLPDKGNQGKTGIQRKRMTWFISVAFMVNQGH